MTFYQNISKSNDFRNASWLKRMCPLPDLQLLAILTGLSTTVLSISRWASVKTRPKRTTSSKFRKKWDRTALRHRFSIAENAGVATIVLTTHLEDVGSFRKDKGNIKKIQKSSTLATQFVVKHVWCPVTRVYPSLTLT